MKIIKLQFLLFIFLGCITYSCSNDHDENLSSNISDKELHNVRISMSSFTSETSGMRSTSNVLVDLKDYSSLYYSIAEYSSESSSWTFIEHNYYNQRSGMPESLNIKLSKGVYRISVGLTKDESNSSDFGDTPVATRISSSEPISISPSLLDSEVYQSTVQVEVNNTDIETNLVLNRAVGKVQLAINGLDKLPEEVKSIVPVLVRRSTNANRTNYTYMIPRGFYVDNSGTIFRDIKTSLDLNAKNTYNTIVSPRSEFTKINQDNPFTFYLSDTENIIYDKPESTIDFAYDLYLQASNKEKVYSFASPRSKDLESYFDENTVFMKCLVKDFKIQPNKQVIIKGNIAIEPNNSLQIFVNQDWDADINEIVIQ